MSQAPELASVGPASNIPSGLSVIAAHNHLILGRPTCRRPAPRYQAVAGG
jgi:hypothetical protein